MAGSLRRKKRAKAAAGKKTQKVGVTTNFQTGRARVDHAVVSLPGAPRATEPWNVDATLTRNYAASGLASDANVAGRGGRNAMDDPGASVREAVATLATSNGDETRALLGETKTSGFSAPKRLTPKQTRVVEALVKALRGSDTTRAVPVMVGGYPFNLEPELWRRLGASGHAPNASRAVEVGLRLVRGADA